MPSISTAGLIVQVSVGSASPTKRSKLSAVTVTAILTYSFVSALKVCVLRSTVSAFSVVISSLFPSVGSVFSVSPEFVAYIRSLASVPTMVTFTTVLTLSGRSTG